MLLLVGNLPQAHAGLTDVPVTGTAEDLSGRRLGGVRISDGFKWVLTDSNGQFSINEPLGSTVTLSASKTGLVDAQKSVNVLIGATAAFQLLYTLSVTLTPDAFNNSSPTTVTITAKSHAPSDSCVNWTDQASGTVVALQRDPNIVGPEYLWRGSYAVPSDRSDSGYASHTLVQSCLAGTPITQVLQRLYTIDSVAPSILKVLPGEGSNTVYDQQMIAALIDEGVSGSVAVGGVTFTMTDLTPAPNQQVTQTSRSNSHFRGAWAISPSFELSDNHTYSLTVDVRDKAGNHSRVGSAAAENGGGLTKVSPTFPQPHLASISDHTCDLVPDPDSILFQMALCLDVPVSLSGGTLQIDLTRHSYDIGFVDHTVRFDAAKLKSTVEAGGIERPEEVPARNSQDPLWDPKTMFSTFNVPSEDSLPLEVSLSSESTLVPVLKVRNVPLYWREARLNLDAPADSSFRTCADPITASGNVDSCSSDPFANRFIVELEPGAQSVASIAAEHLDATDGRFDLLQDDELGRWYETEIDPLTIKKIEADDRVKGVTRTRALETTIRTDSAFRDLVHLHKSDSEILTLYRNASLTTRDRKDGALFTPTEVAELNDREASLADSSAIREWVSANGHGNTFGGTHFDHSQAKLVVSFTEAAQARASELASVVVRPSRLTPRTVDWSIQQLEAKAEEVAAAVPGLAADDGIFVHFVSAQAKGNTVIVKTKPSLGAAEFLQQRFGPSISVIEAEPGEFHSFHDSLAKDLCRSAEQAADVDCGGLPDDERVARSSAGYIAGAGIDIGGPGACTLGFTMFDLNKPYPSQYGIYSAGHCGEPREIMVNGGANHFRVVTDWDVEDHDADVLWGGLTMRGQTSDAIITGARSGVRVVSPHSNGHDEEGSRRCMSGFQTGYHCGYVTDTNAKYCTTISRCADGMVVYESSKNILDGDSGAPIWHPADGGGANASGILAGTSYETWPWLNNVVYTKWNKWPGTAFVK